MRHRKGFNHLGRKAGHRRALLANLASQLITHKRIKTTLAKAKALRQYAEPLLTKAKNNDTHSRRTVFSYLQDKSAVAELFDQVAVKIADRPGGYTRIIKLGTRLGDNAEMCMIELVDYNDLYSQTKEAKPSSKKRTRRGKRKTADAVADVAETASKSAESVKDAATDVAEAVSDKVESAKDAVVEVADKAKDAVSDATASEEKKEDDTSEEEPKA